MVRIWAPSTIPYVQIVVALALVGSLAIGFTQQGIPILYPFIQEEFGASRAQLGLITTALQVGGMGTIILIGWLADTIGVRRVLTVALFMVTIGFLLFSQIQSLTQGFLLALPISIAATGTAPATTKAIMDWVKSQTRGLAMGIKETAVPISGVIGAVLLPFLAVTFSWRIALMSVAVIIAVSGVVFFAFYRDKSDNGIGRKRSGLLRSIGILAKNRGIWLAALGNNVLVAMHIVVVSYLILFLKEHLGMSAAVAGSYLAIAFTGSGVGRIGWGLVSDSLGGRRAVVLAFVCMLIMVFMALMTWLPADASPLVVGVLVFVLGATAMGFQGLLLTFVVELAGVELAATATGFTLIIQRTNAFIPPLFGLIVDRTGSYDMAWLMMAGIASVGVLVFALAPQQPMRQ